MSIILSAEDLDVTPVVFNREGFGRQSMSEKRKGHIDPRGTDVYQKIRNEQRFLVWLVDGIFFFHTISLCSQGMLWITTNSTVFKDGLGNYVK